jgi:hypothetical protein
MDTLCLTLCRSRLCLQSPYFGLLSATATSDLIQMRLKREMNHCLSNWRFSRNIEQFRKTRHVQVPDGRLCRVISVSD